MPPRRQKRLVTILVLFIGISGVVALILLALQNNIDLFYTPTEVVQGKGAQKQVPQVGQRLRIGGMVVPGSVKRDPNSLKIRFDLIDAGGPVVCVEYDGILPDLFREGQGIVANGVLVAPQKVRAVEVLAKHDENYMAPDVAEALNGVKHSKPEYTAAQLAGSQTLVKLPEFNTENVLNHAP